MIYSYLLANYRTMPLPQIQSTVPGSDESETPEAEKTQAALSAIGRGSKHKPGGYQGEEEQQDYYKQSDDRMPWREGSQS